MGADNYVQSGLGTQGFNRYSYAGNNPLKYSDPSGDVVWFVPVIAGALAGGYLGGLGHDGWTHLAPWDWNWDNEMVQHVTVGAIIGGAAGTIIGGVWGAGITGASIPKGFSIAAHGFGLGNLNMAVSALDGQPFEAIWKAGLSGVAMGASFASAQFLTPFSGLNEVAAHSIQGAMAGAFGGTVDGIMEANIMNLQGTERSRYLLWHLGKGAFAGAVAGALYHPGYLDPTDGLALTHDVVAASAWTYLNSGNNTKNLVTPIVVSTVMVGTMLGVGLTAGALTNGAGLLPGMAIGGTLGTFWGIQVGNALYRIWPDDPY